MIQKGTKVQYSKAFLQSISCSTGDLPRAKGIVTEIKDFGDFKIATIDWDLPEIPLKVNVKNLQ